VKISCVIVSFNNGDSLRDAILSVIQQTRPVDEIIVADDASTDGSRALIDAFCHNHANIRAIYRESNLGVSTNRDLAILDAGGDLITWLDGDDHYLHSKIELELRAVGQRRDVIGYSDVRIEDQRTSRIREAALTDFALLSVSGRIRWLLSRKDAPRSMLVPKRVHIAMGGFNRSLRTYEDWDYVLRLAAQPLPWAHSGVEGTVHHPGGGLSRQSQIEHLRDEFRVLRLNHRIIRRHAGLGTLLSTTGRVVAVRSKWGIVNAYWHVSRRMTGR